MKEVNNIDSLLRGELSAVEAYNQVIAKVSDKAEVSKLQAFKQDHEKSVTTLRRFANSEVVADAQDSGPWGVFVKAFTGTASVFGDKAALAALKTGESHGAMEYERALKDDSISAELKNIIRAELLPCQQKHIAAIETIK